MSLFYVLWFCQWCTLFFNILNLVSSGTVLTKRTSGCRNASFPEECGLGETQPHFPISKSEQEPGEDSGVPEAFHPASRPFLSPLKLHDVSCGHAWASIGEGFWSKGEGRMDLLAGRERERWRGGRISIQASQQGYKEFIVWKKCFLPLPPTARAVMQRNSFLSDHYRRFLEGKNGKTSACNAINYCFLSNYSLWCCVQ